MKVHNIKPDYAALAAEMGEDVTPKAITHQFARLKSLGKGAANTSSPARGKSSANNSPRTPGKTSAGVNKRINKAKKPTTPSNKDVDEDDDDTAGHDATNYDEMDADGAEPEVPSPGVDRSDFKRAASVNGKRSYVEDASEDEGEVTPTAQRVKREDSIASDVY